MRSAIKYKDRHQNEVIFVTSGTHFFTLFLQKKRLSESSEFRSAHDISPYNHPFTFTGKERDAETGYSYFGARYYDSDLSGLFLCVDPMADKYPSISPYAYCAWNPEKLVDPNGDSIKISGNVNYLPNMSSEGYTGFEKKAIDALNLINTTEEGATMLTELVGYGNDIDIFDGFTTNYEVNGPLTAFYNETNNIPGDGLGLQININWNIESPESIQTLQGMQVNATYNLLDEICHAYDLCTGYGTFATTNEGFSKAEFQAVYRSNVVRHQLKDYNYRSQYYNNQNDSRGEGPITARTGKQGNIFYQPSWYPKCKSDNVSYLLQGF